MPDELWRTGRPPIDEPGPRRRTIYDEAGELIGVAWTTENAERIVAAVNASRTARPALSGRAPSAVYGPDYGEAIAVVFTAEAARRALEAGFPVMGLPVLVMQEGRDG